ncbi:MAG: 16S rRNA (guanine(527)-N(7))-methyltransferase RsmG [Candidatus Peregrinibacteria bacterium]|nr:16S rRNA (guanine(527)-N(7))-methyltransferase RsmG [Candidatus Peregrinibacteria bacterium]MDZ4244903.1 16S rRNA (guanine(527)-N(7))-methyltransferase RsmG [Candidatus Gracilibacteria bacterium]
MTEIDKSLFEPFMKTLLQANKDINLISREIKEEEDLFVKHIYDSVKIIDFFDFSNSVTLLDIGSGGGIPGIPLAIALPHLKITLMDSVEKKMRRAKSITEELKLNNVKILIGRTEEKGHDPNFRESFDIVTARAVAELPVLLEYALPFVKVGGYFIAYKGRNHQEELSESKTALYTLGAKLTDVFSYDLPNDLGQRVYIICKKISDTPEKYPRKIGIPKKTPLK